MKTLSSLIALCAAAVMLTSCCGARDPYSAKPGCPPKPVYCPKPCKPICPPAVNNCPPQNNCCY